jgi:hypothetical protein
VHSALVFTRRGDARPADSEASIARQVFNVKGQRGENDAAEGGSRRPATDTLNVLSLLTQRLRHVGDGIGHHRHGGYAKGQVLRVDLVERVGR